MKGIIKRKRKSLSFGVLRFLKPALIPTRVLRAKAETRVDIWNEIEARGKERERRRKANRTMAANLSSKFGRPS